MNTNRLMFAGLLAAALVPASAFADELIIASDMAKSGTRVVGLELQSSGEAAGIEIRIEVNAGSGAKVDTSGCASAVPASHIGSCVFNGKEVVILLYSMSNHALPAGPLDLGTFAVSYGVGAKSEGPVVSSFIAATADGRQIESGIHSDNRNDVSTK